jgi:hypothetical protein
MLEGSILNYRELGFTEMNAQSSTPFSDRPNIINASAAFSMMAARPGLQLSKATCPVLVVMAEQDDIIAGNVTRDICAKAGNSECSNVHD